MGGSSRSDCVTIIFPEQSRWLFFNFGMLTRVNFGNLTNRKCNRLPNSQLEPLYQLAEKLKHVRLGGLMSMARLELVFSLVPCFGHRREKAGTDSHEERRFDRFIHAHIQSNLITERPAFDPSYKLQQL